MVKNIALTGMMGVGKSTVGKILAKKLNYNFIDVDKIIELKEGNSISSIFKNKGEIYFRKIENDITMNELKKSKSVISLGGGAFINNLIRQNTKKTSTSFWLDVPVEEIIKRLKNNKLQTLKPESSIYINGSKENMQKLFVSCLFTNLIRDFFNTD